MRDYYVYCGAVGWEHEDWLNDFYPENLPTDWMLSFYNTQFRCTYLAYAKWYAASEEIIAGWLDDVQQGFQFVLEVPDQADADLREKAQRFAEYGVLSSTVDLVWLEGALDLRELAGVIGKVQEVGRKSYLIDKDSNLGRLRQVSELMQLMGV